MADGIKKISENVIADKRALVITDPLVRDNDAISIGALQSNPSTKGLKLKTAKNTYSLFDAAQVIIPGTITTELLIDKCVTNIKLGDKAVTEIKIDDNAISERTIIDLNVTENKIGNSAVTELKIKDSAVTTKHYRDLSIINSKIANNTIENTKLLDKTITNIKIADGTIINSLLAPNSVGEYNIIESSIKNSHLKDGSVYGDKIKNAAIKNIHLDVNCVNSQNILNGAIISNKIADKQISGNHIINGCIESIHLANQSVTKDKLATNSVSTVAIVDKSVNKNKLADDVIQLIGDPVKYDTNNNVTLRKDLAVNGSVNIVGNLTAKKVYNAVFMDIAEAYIPGEELEPGDIVQMGSDGKVYKSDLFSNCIVGVVSDQYAVCYGATEEDLEEGIKVAVGLIGKVPVKVKGYACIGQYITLSNIDGVGYATNSKQDRIVGKVLENVDLEDYSKNPDAIREVLCLIYPN